MKQLKETAKTETNLENITLAHESAPNLLELKNISVAIDSKPILANLTFNCTVGCVVACVGSNGSGKSSLLYTIMGNPMYEVTAGSIFYLGQDITHMPVDQRARLGIFLTFQQPYEIPGVLVSTLLKESFRALCPGTSLDVYIDRLAQGAQLLGIERSMLDRAVHAGFSGGEKKKLEMLQAFIVRPKLLMLDELDSGLDVDARKVVGHTLATLKQLVPDMTLLIVTHHDTLFEYVTPDVVHVLAHGQLQKSGDKKLLSEIQKSGYGK